MSDDSSSDGLTSFLFYTLFVYPSCSWILKPGRFPRKTAILYAIGFLACLAFFKTGFEIAEKPPNHYCVLGVTRSSTAMEIKKSYKRLSLELHPDKNKSPDAADQFSHLKSSYDVLMDLENRVVYNKFGSEGVKNNKSTFDETAMLLEMGIFYGTWAMLSFVLTLGKSGTIARTWIYTGMIVMLLVEITLMTQEDPLPEWFFPRTTEFEWIWLLHLLFPAFMNGCRCLGGFLYVDVDGEVRKLLGELKESHRDVLLVLRDVQIGVQSLSARGGGGQHRLGGGGGQVDAAEGGSPMKAPIIKATPTGKLKELETKLAKSNAQVEQAVGALKNEGGKGSGLGFYAMIIGYIALTYFFNN
ncbi:hypothetical protein TrST_g8104 [Triparma strigata]|uniref:J domain-containing protein n=1 Tax=Triparma strigata TaxID=1606541 RepID=A0A9W7F385_9STRA|nr:hypothetical protein TrST_g8104 [Triparma strigata]